MTQQTFRVWAQGSTDAADKAKARARDNGLRVQTVAAVRPVGRVPLPGDRAEWDVTLAVRDPSPGSVMDEATLIAGYGGLPGGAVDPA